MREETDQYRDSSSNPNSEIYDSSIVDSLDLQSLSLNYPPIKPKRREDTPTYSSSSSSNDQDSFPRQIDIKMFPAWFFDCSQRDRSPDTQVIDDISTPTGRFRDETGRIRDDTRRFREDTLPSYNNLYQLDIPGQYIPGQSSTSTARQYSTDGPATGYPLVGGLDFSGWENNDPEGDACFAAVSSASRGSEDMEGGTQSHDGEEGGTVEERSPDRSVESDQLVDLDTPNVPHRFPPTHRPDYPGYSSYPPLYPSRFLSKPKSPYQGEFDQNPDESMCSYSEDFESSLDSNNGIGSKRKYDDAEAGYESNGEGTAGPSTQSGFKRGRFRFLSSSEDGCDEKPARQHLIYGGLTMPTSVEAGEEWQGDSLTADTPDNGEAQSNSSRGDTVHRDINNPHQQPNEAFSPQDDSRSHHIQEDGAELDVNGGGHQQQQYSESTFQQQYSEGSDPDSAIEAVQWPSDTLTVVDPSADWLGHVPVHTSQTPSDEVMEQSEIDTRSQSPVHPADIQESQSLPESQMAVEPLSTLSPIESTQHPSPQAIIDTESRKRPAEESQHPTPSPIRKKIRKPAPKIILPKALPKPKSPIPSSPQSSPARPRNTTLGMKPRKPRNSAPNRPSAPTFSTNTAPHKDVVIDKGPVEFFASLKSRKKVATVKQKPFKSPLAGGGITLKPKDPNQPSTSINYGNSNPSSSNSNMSIAGRLAMLEKEARTLRQAVKYKNEIEEDERLQHLIIQWRAAGRDVVEQIFDRIPKPSENDEVKQARNPWMTGGRDDMMELTDEQEKWLEICDKNEDGEPIDDEGNPLIPGPQPNDLKNLMEEASKPRRGEKQGYHPRYEHDSTGRRPVQAESREWNMGTMMIKMSVDPALLGWDDDLEDWVDSDSL